MKQEVGEGGEEAQRSVRHTLPNIFYYHSMYSGTPPRLLVSLLQNQAWRNNWTYEKIRVGVDFSNTGNL